MSVHFPKAAGTATADLLQRAFGEGLLLDYASDPANPHSPRNLDPHRFLRGSAALPPGTRAVHGHFHPGKYGDVPGATWVTVLRHPVDTLISIYWYWLGSEPQGPLHAYFRDEQLTVLELARLPLLRRLMSETYFGGVDMRRFALVGRHEARDEALGRLAALLDRPLPPDERRNETPDQGSLGDMLADARLRSQLQDVLADDVAFYDTWAG